MVFVVIEGLDASGKTTQAERLSSYLEGRGLTVYTRFHPEGDNWAGRRAKRFLLAEGRSAHFAAAIFYILDVLRSVLLTPWLIYDYIVYVRYLMGTAYLPPPLGTFAYHFFATFLPDPKHTFYLQIPPQEAYRRIDAAREEKEMFESHEQLEKIGSRAADLARRNRWTVVEADKPPDDIERHIRESLLQTAQYSP
ncbi:MAG: thymidylate kinase, partial [Candidatus Bathyarchaeota archaeon]